MENSKLIELLQTFSKEEMRRFRDFAASPFFNKSEELAAFANYLEELSPGFPSRKISKEVVFLKLFPGQAFDARQMAYLMNYLLKLAEQFLAVQRYEEDETLVNCHILEQFVDRKLEKHYQFLFKRTSEALNEKQERDEMWFFHRYRLSKIAADHFISLRIREFDPTLQMASDTLDDFYFFHKLKFACEMLNRQSILSVEYLLHFVEEVKEFLLRKEDKNPLIGIYLSIFLSLASPEEEKHFQVLMELIERHSASIDKKEMREIYLYAINFCARKIRNGQESYIPVVLKLYEEGIADRSLLEGNYLSHWTYTNVVKLALRLERYAWIEDFIETYSPTLAPDFRRDAQHYNLAELFYHKKDFDRVLDHLSQLHFSDLHYHLGSRVILIKTYYEQDALEPLLSMLASFSVYLRRNKKISLPIKKTYLNFCGLLHQVLRNNPRKRADIKEEIQSTQLLAERAWLLQAWEEMGGMKKFRA